MDRTIRRRILILISIAATTFATAARTEGFMNIRGVQILLLLSSGMCIGVALSLFMLRKRLLPPAGEQ